MFKTILIMLSIIISYISNPIYGRAWINSENINSVSLDNKSKKDGIDILINESEKLIKWFKFIVF
jgi:hypothetical protein